MTQSKKIYREAMLSYGDWKRRGHRFPWILPAVGNKVSHIYSTLHRVVIMVSAISQLRVLASHTGSLGSVAQGVWKLEDLAMGRCHFLSDS